MSEVPPPTQTTERIHHLMLARQQAYAALQRYRVLLSAESAKLGIDHKWLDGVVRNSLYQDFMRKAEYEVTNSRE